MMVMAVSVVAVVFVLLASVALVSSAAPPPPPPSSSSIWGEWRFDASAINQSSPLPLLQTVDLVTTNTSTTVCVNATYGAHSEDPVNRMSCFPVDGTASTQATQSRVFVQNVFLGVAINTSVARVIRGDATTAGELKWTEESVLLVNQGQQTVNTSYTARMLSDGRLQFAQVWTSRAREPLVFYLARTNEETYTVASTASRATATATASPAVASTLSHGHGNGGTHATTSGYYFEMGDDWSISSQTGLGVQTLMLSLAGLANRDGARLYLVYPNDWAFTYTPALKAYYEHEHNVSWTALSSVSDAVKALGDVAKGYIVWDKEVPESMSVAFTMAGLQHGLAVTEDEIPLLNSLNVPMLKDLRGKFVNMTDAQVIQWSFDNYFTACNHSFVMWLGGECTDTRRPAVADFGVMASAFFAGDLSTRPSDVDEYALANVIMSSVDEYAVTIGWHSYCKDEEHFFTTLMSHHAARVHGLNTLPSLSFINNMQLLPGFRFANHHTPYTPPASWDKVFVSCVQSDGLGLGAWNKPGRGELPYTWEVTVNDLWLQPTLLEMFYRQATPNDYFIAALSGPGYVYPKAVGLAHLPHMLDMAAGFMRTLDLNAYAVMDESQGQVAWGNMDLPSLVVDAYMQHMPEAVGFVNGYGPAFTFATNGTRPFMSYDYYLDPSRDVLAAARDLQQLATLNRVRPYYMVIHVREWSSILRVKSILALLTDEFVLMPTDLLFQTAGRNATFATRFEKSALASEAK